MITLLVALALGAPQSAPTVTVRAAEPGEYEAAVARVEPSPQGDWRVLTPRSDATMALDVANVVQDGSLRTVWLARVGGNSAVSPGAYMIMKLRIDCDNQLAQPLFWSLRSPAGRNLVGQSVQEEPAPYDEGSGGAEVAAVVCDGVIPTGAGFSTHQAFAASVASAPEG